MYAFIRGNLVQVEPSYALIEAKGVGFKIHISSRTFSQLPSSNEELLLYTSLIIREFSHMLYGFLQEEERNLFDILIDISGIGPKMALALLGHLSLPQLQEVILQDDLRALSKVPGIGKKTAERLLVELRNKLETFFACNPAQFSIATKRDPKSEKIQDGIKALISLGYGYSAAQKAIKKSLDEKEETDLSSLVTAALKHVR